MTYEVSYSFPCNTVHTKIRSMFQYTYIVFHFLTHFIISIHNYSHILDDNFNSRIFIHVHFSEVNVGEVKDRNDTLLYSLICSTYLVPGISTKISNRISVLTRAIIHVDTTTIS